MDECEVVARVPLTRAQLEELDAPALRWLEAEINRKLQEHILYWYWFTGSPPSRNNP